MSQKLSLTRKACYIGFLVQGIVNNLISILFIVFNAEPYDISIEKLGRIILINFSAQLVIDFLSIYIVPFFGTKKCVVVSQTVSFVGFILLGILPNVINAYYGIIIAVLFLATGSGLIEVVISPVIEAVTDYNKAGKMSFTHAFYCWGHVLTVVFATLFLLFTGRSNWFYIPFVLSLIPFFNTFIFKNAEIKEISRVNGKKNADFSILKEKAFYLYLILMLSAGAAEIAMVQWASFFIETGFNIEKWLGDLLGPCLFAVFMGLGRVLYSAFGEKISTLKIIGISAVLCTICYLVVAVSSNSLVSFVFCALCGLSVGVMWPSVLSQSAAEFKGKGSTMFSLLAMFGDTGCSLGPWLLGLIAEKSVEYNFAMVFANKFCIKTAQAGLHFGFFVSAIFPLIIVVVISVLFLVKRHKK